jgi:hypothetical protein
MAGSAQRKAEDAMKKRVVPILLCGILIASLLMMPGCTGRGDEDDEDLAPFLYQDTFEIWPEPAQLYEDATFLVGWKDHDGDMNNPVVIVNLVNEQGDQVLLNAENIKVEGEEEEMRTTGALSFTIRIEDGYQGDYYILVRDEAGNLSNEISRFLFVNTVPPEDFE